jgi:hypothetical protein
VHDERVYRNAIWARHGGRAPEDLLGFPEELYQPVTHEVQAV